MTGSSLSARPLAGRCAVVTGAGKGVGRAIAERLAADGARVLVNNRHRPGAFDSAGETVAAIRAAGGEAEPERSDVAAPGAAETIVAAAREAFGRLDILVLNAGVTGDAARFRNAGSAGFEEVMRINFTSTVELVHAALPHLLASDAPRILAVASTAGLYGVKGRAPYAASKGALIGFARTLAAEFASGPLKVNILLPYAATQMTGDAMPAAVRRKFSVHAVAPVAARLCAPDFEETGGLWTTGGGRVARTLPVEADGAPAPDFAGADAGLERARTYPDAEAAFAGFAERVFGAEAGR